MSKPFRRLFLGDGLQIRHPVPSHTPRAPLTVSARVSLHSSTVMPDIRPDDDDGMVAFQKSAENELDVFRETTKREKVAFQNEAASEGRNESTANPPPKLSQADFKVYNTMAETMEYFVRKS